MCKGKKSAFVVKCDVSGSSTFEELLRILDDFRHSGVVCGLRNLTQAGGNPKCMCRAVCRNCIDWARYWSFVPNIVSEKSAIKNM